ncbi:Molybdenum cofactor sulfurase [Exophiala dermatitidis]|uniref:Molybdenum cofactor sulfurase n=1 Tax=Exophiala dermatitidis (strain ATCC 34100 / CBS 525.76 / NIH/UT8656) TaxID=858893 RepID=H6BLJ3_EXODN|nr:selenocysteine lyase [Exophiala dermatitidis NIH/UT8656]EHY51886.1 selenocysteine lyase [Exophiala dermatitidis NIH/UT8656]
MMPAHDHTSRVTFSVPTVTIDPETGYFVNIDEIRDVEYPALAETTYLDHAGTTLYAKSLIDSYSRELTSKLFGNPHSASASSQLSSRRIDDVRFQALRFFNADPGEFDIVFVANATAAIKLVGDALRDHQYGFKYWYHGESHTSLVGLREIASRGSSCLSDDEMVEDWLTSLDCASPAATGNVSLFAYPAQSNMTGRRLPLEWCRRVNGLRSSSGRQIFTLLDAAALVSTAPLDLSDTAAVPDFVAVSFYKIFGFPDVGALVVRKSSGEILRQHRYFGGGTVDSVTMLGATWYAKRESSLHTSLEDGTLPFHNIIALQTAFDVHRRLYGSMRNISRHTAFLASTLRSRLQSLQHGNGSQVCTVYTGNFSTDDSQGPVIAFNMRDKKGKYVSNTEVEKLGVVNSVQFRTGGLCNPGGVAYHLGLSAEQMRRNHAMGLRCGGENDLIDGMPTGAIRISLGAMSNVKDVETFVNFIQEFHVDPCTSLGPPVPCLSTRSRPSFYVESLSVFPVKSCAAYKIPSDTPWEVGPQGLAWDRQWCLVHQGTNVGLSQKKFPRMALLRPEIDLPNRVLRLTFESESVGNTRRLEISLDVSPETTTCIGPCDATTRKTSTICGEDVIVRVYTSAEVSEFFTEALGVPCTLARYPQDGSVRQAKLRVPRLRDATNMVINSGFATSGGKSIALANESPILLISRSSVNSLNEQIKLNSGGVGQAVAAESFRGNIVIAEELRDRRIETPYAEEEWTSIRIGKDTTGRDQDTVVNGGPGHGHTFEILGPCQRCQMVCVDQKSAQRRQEPFSTLAKTRRRDGRVWFGMHMCLSSSSTKTQPAWIQVGDRVAPMI